MGVHARRAREGVVSGGLCVCARDTRASSMETAGGGGARDEGMRCVGLGLVRALTRETRRDETRRDARGEILTVRLFVFDVNRLSSARKVSACLVAWFVVAWRTIATRISA